MHGAAETEWIIAKATETGFDLCGIVSANDVADPEHLREWLERGYAGRMQYMHDPRRADITRVLPEARSLVVCALNYNTARPASTEAAVSSGQENPRGWISRYAWGDDYHFAMEKKLEDLLAAMRERFGEAWQARTYVDTGPISERVAAQQAGLGWQAKNTCIINENVGSFLFLGVILTSLDLTASNTVTGPAADQCGHCSLCLEACPTGALVEPYVMDARSCIAYLTIELREAIPEEFRGKIGWHVFGCDICQDVCPWNRKAPCSTEASFQPRDQSFMPELEWLLSIPEEEFNEIFSRSPIRRAKWRGVIRNACIAAGNLAGKDAADSAQRSRLRVRLNEMASSSDPLIAEHARWALRRFAAE